MTINKSCTAARRSIGLLAIALVSFSPSFARADADADAGSTNSQKRPIEELFKTDLVYPQEEGELELELASVYQNHSGGDTWTLPVSLEYGLTDRWQVESEWDALVQRYPRNQPVARGVGDVDVGSQYSFMNIGGSLWHLAARFSVQFPVGDVNKDLSEGFVEYQPALILARDFPELHHTQFFTEMGASLLRRAVAPADKADEQPAAHELNWGGGCFVLFSHAAATLELNWDDNRWNHHGTEDEIYVTPGFLWRAARNVELGLGIPVGLNRGADRFDVLAHIVWEF
ncbi:MAG: hypothetical protein ABSA47_02875 [Verrucomicrobiota bacterium]|jgi:hypothetical protein